MTTLETAETPEQVPARASVVVAGAGIVGLSLAFELARRRVDVLVLEWRTPGAGAAGVAAGMLAPAAEAEHENQDLVQLAQESQRRYPSFVAAVEQASGQACGFRQEGTLIAALTRDDEAELDHLARYQQRLGLSCAWLTAEQARDLEPQLSPRIVGALHAQSDYQVDPAAMVDALRAAVVAQGGRVVTGARVTGFDTQGGRLAAVAGRLATPGSTPPQSLTQSLTQSLRSLPPAAMPAQGSLRPGTSPSGSTDAEISGPASHAPEAAEVGEPFAVRCEAAVLAAGAWSSDQIAWPAAPLGVRPVKGQLLHLRGPELIRHVVRAPHVYLVPRRNGRLVVGATMEELGFDATPTAGAVMDLLWNARLVVPAVYDLALAEVKVGFRPATRDHLPVIGQTEVPGLFVATGHFRHGVLLAPGTAVLLAETLTGGGVPPALAPFSPRRLAETGRMTGG